MTAGLGQGAERSHRPLCNSLPARLAVEQRGRRKRGEERAGDPGSGDQVVKKQKRPAVVGAGWEAQPLVDLVGGCEEAMLGRPEKHLPSQVFSKEMFSFACLPEKAVVANAKGLRCCKEYFSVEIKIDKNNLKL